jgi:AraC-like DNA-binding protein
VEDLLYDGAAKLWHHRSGRFRMASPHRHADLEMNLAVEGRAAYLIDGVRVVIEAGHLLFLHQDEDHLLIEESADFRMWIAVWRPRVVGAQVAAGLDPTSAQARPAATELRRLPTDESARLARLCADVVTAGDAAPAGQAYLLWRARGAFAAADDVTRSVAHPAVARAAQLLRIDPSARLDGVARQAGLSSDRLGRLFRQHTGLTLVDYRTRLRLEQACAAWRPGADLLALALQAGFGSYSAFNRAFHRRYGRAPRDFMAQAAVGDRVGA